MSVFIEKKQKKHYFFRKNKHNMTDWSKLFDKIFCISLAENIERREELVKELERVWIDTKADYFEWKFTVKNPNYELMYKSHGFSKWVGWELPRHIGSLNCTMAHYEVMMESIARGFKKILIIEDDIKFHKDIDFIERIFNETPECDICLYEKNIPLETIRDKFLDSKNERESEFFDYNNTHLWGTGCLSLSLKAMKFMVGMQNICFMPADYVTNNLGIEDGLIRIAPFQNAAIQDFNFVDTIDEFTKHAYDFLDINDYNISKSWKETI